MNDYNYLRLIYASVFPFLPIIYLSLCYLLCHFHFTLDTLTFVLLSVCGAGTVSTWWHRSRECGAESQAPLPVLRQLIVNISLSLYAIIMLCRVICVHNHAR